MIKPQIIIIISSSQLYYFLTYIKAHMTEYEKISYFKSACTFPCQRVSRESRCQGVCSELRADMQLYHMICLINGPQQQHYMATGKSHFSVDGKE